MNVPQNYDELVKFIEYTKSIFKIEVTHNDLINAILLLSVEHNVDKISKYLRNFLINDKTSNVELLMTKIYNDSNTKVNQLLFEYLIKDINEKYKINIA